MLSATVFYLFTGYTWLRSGYNYSAYNAQYLTASGLQNYAYPARLLAVRPALYKKGFSLAKKLRVAVMRGFINLPSSVLTTVSPPSPEGEG